jgi:hypothetical protein
VIPGESIRRPRPEESASAERDAAAAHDQSAVGAPALEGDLAVFPTTDLFQFFALLGLSGTLELLRDGPAEPERVRLRLRGGRLVEAETTGPRPYLGELLVRRYGVSIEAVIDGLQSQTAARRGGGAGPRLGQMLLERRQLSADVLRRALDDAVSRVAGPVLLWETGSFAFWPDPSPMVPQAMSGHGLAPRVAVADPCEPEVSLEELVLRRWNAGEGAE